MKKQFILLLVIMALPTVYADSVVISELLVNPTGSDSGKEFIELYNPTDSSIDISNWQIQPKPAPQVARTSTSPFSYCPSFFDDCFHTSIRNQCF